MSDTPECLLLSHQLCFPLYAASKAMVRQYTPKLAPFGLTYTQYIVLLSLYENGTMSVANLGETLYLDSGTLSPLLKKMEKLDYIVKRKGKDGRFAYVELTQKSLDLREKLSQIPPQIGKCVPLDDQEALALFSSCLKIAKELR